MAISMQTAAELLKTGEWLTDIEIEDALMTVLEIAARPKSKDEIGKMSCARVAAVKHLGDLICQHWECQDIEPRPFSPVAEWYIGANRVVRPDWLSADIGLATLALVGQLASRIDNPTDWNWLDVAAPLAIVLKFIRDAKNSVVTVKDENEQYVFHEIRDLILGSRFSEESRFYKENPTIEEVVSKCQMRGMTRETVENSIKSLKRIGAIKQKDGRLAIG
jgi:hypothetical protein